MNCTRVMRDEITERYLAGLLTEADREAFEEHYFECARCASELEALTLVQGELQAARSVESRRTPTGEIRLGRWLALAAAATIVAAVIFWPRASVAPPPAMTTAPAPGQAAPTAPEAPVPDRMMALAELAAVAPPAYRPGTLRSPDPATRRFREAMQSYEAGDFAGAIPGLEAAAAIDAQQAQTQFFLGACHLATDNVDAAIRAWQATVGLGESAYLEQAHFYLAKAFLRKADVSAARVELQRTIALRGDREAEATALLAQLEKLSETAGR